MLCVCRADDAAQSCGAWHGALAVEQLGAPRTWVRGGAHHQRIVLGLRRGAHLSWVDADNDSVEALDDLSELVVVLLHVLDWQADVAGLDYAVGDRDRVDAVAVLALIGAADARRVPRNVVLDEGKRVAGRHRGLRHKAIARAEEIGRKARNLLVVLRDEVAGEELRRGLCARGHHRVESLFKGTTEAR